MRLYLFWEKYRRILLPAVLVLLIAVTAFVWFGGYFSQYGFGYDAKSAEAPMRMYFLDVGQGDSTLVVCEGKTVMIDTGTAATAEETLAKVSGLGVAHIDLLILTHPDADHVGGTERLLTSVYVEKIALPSGNEELMSDAAYRSVLAAAEKADVPVVAVGAGNDLSVGELTVSVLGPLHSNYKETNTFSIVTKLTYGGCTYLFPGDADATAEGDLVETYGEALKSTVLHVGHHGSSTSTGEAFLDAVSPEYAVISVGKYNTYGHPTALTLEKLQDREIAYYRTDWDGTVLLCSDGETIWKAKPYR